MAIDEGIFQNIIAIGAAGNLWWPFSLFAGVPNIRSAPLLDAPSASPKEFTLGGSAPASASGVKSREVVASVVEGSISLDKYYELILSTETMVRKHPSDVSYTVSWTTGQSIHFFMEMNPSGSLIHYVVSEFSSAPAQTHLIQYDSDSGTELDRVTWTTSIIPTSGIAQPHGLVSHGDEIFVLWTDKAVQFGPSAEFAVFLDKYSRTTPMVLLDSIELYRGVLAVIPFQGACMGPGKSAESPAGKRINVKLIEPAIPMDVLRTFTTDLVETFDTLAPTSNFNVFTPPRSVADGLENLPSVAVGAGTRWLSETSAVLDAIRGTTNLREYTFSPPDALTRFAVTGF